MGVPEWCPFAMSAQARRRVLDRLTGPGGEYELTHQQVRGGGTCRVVKCAPKSVVDLLLDARRFSELEYIRYRHESHTFGDVIDQTARLARALDRLGVRRGDRVAICMRNCPEWPAAFLAPMVLGAVTVLLNGWWSRDEIEYGLRDTGAGVLIADSGRLERIADDLPALGVRVVAVRCLGPLPAGAVGWSDVLGDSGESTLSPVASSPDDDCLMLYTSGSTAKPKAAVSTHRNVVHALMAWEIENRAQSILRNERAVAEPFEVQYRMLVSIPFFHVTACHVCMLSALRLGRRLTLMHRWDAEEALDVIDRERITHFVSVPTVTGDLVRAAARHGRSLPSLLAVGGGGSHRPARQVLAIRDTFENARPGTGWGMTETNAIGTQITAPEYLKVPTSSGRCSALMDMKIVDSRRNGNVAPGDVGEVWVRGTPVFREYWNNPDATAGAFEDGWFKTGDLAFVDDDDFVHFVDRIKDIVIRGGENISCLRVEDALYRCTGVAEAVAFGIPDERLGEELAAVVVPAAGTRLTEAIVQDSMRPHVAQFEVPARIFFRSDPLPRIASGKFAKRSIRQAVLDGLLESG